MATRASAPKTSSQQLKQRSLLSFFAKPPLPGKPERTNLAPQKASESNDEEHSWSTYSQDDNADVLPWSQLLSGEAAWTSGTQGTENENSSLLANHRKRCGTPSSSSPDGNPKRSRNVETSVVLKDECLKTNVSFLREENASLNELHEMESFKDEKNANVNLMYKRRSENTEGSKNVNELVELRSTDIDGDSNALERKNNSNVCKDTETIAVKSNRSDYKLAENENLVYDNSNHAYKGALEPADTRESIPQIKTEMCYDNLNGGQLGGDRKDHSNNTTDINDQGDLEDQGHTKGIKTDMFCNYEVRHAKTPVADSKQTFVKLRRGGGRRVSAPEDPLEAPVTNYEREREENIRRNQSFMQKLGICSTVLEEFATKQVNPKSKNSKCKAVIKAVSTQLPLRRSRRLHHSPEELQSKEPIETGESVAAMEPVTDDLATYDDSSVLKYTCSEFVGSIISHLCDVDMGSDNTRSIIGFRPLNRVLQDTRLTRIYTMSACFPSLGGLALLAAGGHQGQISVFGTSSMNVEDSNYKESLEPNVLMSWKGSSGWISGVKFVSPQTQSNAMLLLSTANDGKIILWDINKQQKLPVSGSLLAGLPPLKVKEIQGIHSNGIFSMHELRGNLATASKDSSIGYCKISNESITAERCIAGHHIGAIRGIHFRDEHTLVDGGADGLICILDLRMAEPCALTIDTNDATGVNVVEWSPSTEHILLSASKDPHLSVFDTRNHKQPLHKLAGHVNPKLQKCSQIYRPTFVDHGRAIASPGQGSKTLSLYSVSNGKTISRGDLGYDPTMVMWSTDGFNRSVLWVASRQIAQFLPVRQKEISYVN